MKDLKSYANGLAQILAAPTTEKRYSGGFSYSFSLDILPSLDLRSPLKRKGRGFLRGRLCRPFGGFLLLTAYFAVHFTG